MVIYVVKVLYGTSKWWPLLTGGRYLEVVVRSGLTVHPFFWSNYTKDHSSKMSQGRWGVWLILNSNFILFYFFK